MDTENRKEEDPWNRRRWEHKHSRSEKVFGGIVVVIVGAFLLARQMGAILPEWLFTWEMLLIVLGFYVGVKHSFRHPVWIIMIFVGTLFLADDIYPDITIGPVFWPVLIILAGLIMIFKPHRSKRCREEKWKRWERRMDHNWKHKWENKWEDKWKEKWGEEEKNAHRQYESSFVSNDDTIETVAVFGGIKKNIISKNFKGGEVVCVFGGAEINLMQADIVGTVSLELTQVFGGTKLIVPSHWEIQHDELIAVLGGIEDKRPVINDVMSSTETKKLILRGNCFLGGIEIRTY